MAALADIVCDCARPGRLGHRWAAALDGYRVAPYAEEELDRLVLIEFTDVEDGCKVLGVGEETHDVEVVGTYEVGPAAREPGDSAHPQAGDVAELTDASRSRAGHALDAVQRSESGIEELLGESLAGLRGVVAGALDQVSFSLQPAKNPPLAIRSMIAAGSS